MATSRTILIVDDDSRFASELGSMLRGAGYLVLEARNSQEAFHNLEKLRTAIDMIMVDLVLPGSESGFEIIGAVTRRPNPIKIIAMSGKMTGNYLKICEHLGAHKSLAKPESGQPILKSEWLGTIEAMLKPSGPLVDPV
jgi:two-component system, OmpR family, alkaline phosphatase synthesis response regulator PhoP